MENLKYQSEQITLIAKALVKAQTSMSNAVKSASNPFFKSKYADINAVREACIPALNENGICAMQPTVEMNGKPFVKTLLIHESGEWIAGYTEIICAKQNDAQSHGSGLSYARRYGLQSMVNLGSEDDDGNAAVKPKADTKPTLAKNSPAYLDALDYIANKGGDINKVKAKYNLTKEVEDLLNAK
jgi:hypothetical protein